MDDQLRAKFWGLYTETFPDLYRYCARRATTKPVIAFIVKSLYDYALDEIKQGQEIILVDMYKWAYEFFAVQAQPGATGGQVKRIHDFRDVYDIKTESGSRAIRREQILEIFYNHLEFKEREVLWLTYFEELLPPDRAYVMGMSDEESTKFFYESLKKAKTVVSMATSDQKGFGRIAAYFGGVASLLRKARQHEQLEPDQEIYTSLRDMFMEQFGRREAGTGTSTSADGSGVPPPMRDPFADVPTVTRAGLKPVTTTKAPEVSESQLEQEDEWLDDESSFAPGLWRKLQGVLVVVVIFGLGSFGYFKYFTLDARVDRFLKDERVAFDSEVSPEDQKLFARDNLLYLVRDREYDKILVDLQDDGYVDVRIVLKDGVTEGFLLYPETQKFDFQFSWQPKRYSRV